MSRDWKFKLEPHPQTGLAHLTILETPDARWGNESPQREYADLLAAAAAYDAHAANVEQEGLRLRMLAHQARAQAMILKPL